jgi:hypothetical protein
MKKFLYTLLVMILCATGAKADQLSLLTKKWSEEAVAYITEHHITRIAIYCGCCQDEKAEMVDISSIYNEPAGYQDYYRVYVMTPNGDRKILDLAYVFILDENPKAGYHCLGKTLGYACFPCVEDGFTINKKGKVKGAKFDTMGMNAAR